MSSKRKYAALAGTALILILAGCAQVTVHSTVNADGTISELQYQANMSRTAYGYLETSAQEDGYDSVKDQFMSNLNESERENAEFTTEYNGDQVTITMRRTDVTPGDGAALNITTQDGKLVYRDQTFVNESASEEPGSGMGSAITSGLAVDYYLEMPGEITDSNADTVDGNTAEWHSSGSNAFTHTPIYAVSKKPTFAGMPGFGPLAAVVGLLLTTLYFRTRAE